MTRTAPFEVLPRNRVEFRLSCRLQPEHRGTGIGLIAADPFEHGCRVVERVHKHVDLCLVPRHEFAVHPYFVGRLKHKAYFITAWGKIVNRFFPLAAAGRDFRLTRRGRRDRIKS